MRANALEQGVRRERHVAAVAAAARRAGGVVRVSAALARDLRVAALTGSVADGFTRQLVIGLTLVQRVARQAAELALALTALVAGRSHEPVVLATADADRAV